MDENPEFEKRLKELKNASISNYESAYTIFNNAGGGIQFSPKYTGNPNDVASGGQVELSTTISSTLVSVNCVGFAHCHKNDGSTYKTFSFSDIFAFSTLAYLSNQNTEQLSLYLTTLNGGTYVMKMTNRIEMRNFYMKLLIPKEFKYYDNSLNEKINKTQTGEEQTLVFLQFLRRELKNMGIEIYEKNDSGVWQKLTLSSNGKTIIKTNI